MLQDKAQRCVFTPTTVGGTSVKKPPTSQKFRTDSIRRWLSGHAVSKRRNGNALRFRVMDEGDKDKIEAVAAAGVGAGVGGAGGATVGVLELASQGAATALSASLVIGLGAAAGGVIAYGIYRFFKKRKS